MKKTIRIAIIINLALLYTLSSYSQNSRLYFTFSEKSEAVQKEKKDLTNWYLKLTESIDEIDVQSTEGVEALYMAIKMNMPQAVQYLVEHKVDINNSLNHKYTPMMTASYFGNAEIADLLIKGGADLQKLSSKGDHLLFVWYEFDKDFWKILRTNETKRLIKSYKKSLGYGWNDEKENAYQMYKQTANFKLASLIAKCLDFSRFSHYKQNPLPDTSFVNQVFENYTNFMDKSFEICYGARKILIPDFEYWFASVVAEYNYEKILNDLLDAGINLEETNEYDETAFYKAITNNNLDKAKLLLKYGANVNHQKKSFGKIYYALDDYSIDNDSRRFLINAGADKIGSDYTFTMILRDKDFDLLNLLIEKGMADVSKIDQSQHLITQAAKQDIESIDFVVKKGAAIENSPQALLSSVGKASVKEYKKLIDLGADVKRKNSKGETVLWKFVNNDRYYRTKQSVGNTFAKLFIDAGAGEYEAIKACKEGDKRALERIFAGGLDVNKPMKNGDTIYKHLKNTIKECNYSRNRKKAMISFLKNSK